MNALDRPVLVLQNLHGDGPGYLGTWLASRGVRMDLRNAEAGDPFPESPEGFAALALLGGEMSANDDLPTLRRAERLFRLAVERDIPTLGHCLGGQLMARALGVRVTPSPAPEVGWHALDLVDVAAARAWFGEDEVPQVFHWHYEAFELPPGARLLASSAACPNQAFSIGPHLAMQFHVELDAGKLEGWLASAGAGYERAQRRHETVQGAERIRAESPRRLPAQQRLADRIYGHWLAGVRSG